MRIVSAAFSLATAVVIVQLVARHSRPQAGFSTERQLAPIAIDYPAEGSIFPPEITAPAFLWRDGVEDAKLWLIVVSFTDGSDRIQMKSPGEQVRIGEIDLRCITKTNELPRLTSEQAAQRTWTPDARTWAVIKKHSLEHPAMVTITGFRDSHPDQAISRGQVTIQTSKDPVGAPIFYRDVPLMPSELEKGVIKPLSPAAVPLIGWRLRNVGESRSQLVMEGLHTCANCHSFSGDGKTLGMDLDGPQNDKGLYTIVPVRPRMSIRNEDVIRWPSFQEMGEAQVRVGFMSQVSPDGQDVVTMVKGAMYVNNFKDYRFLQVFYPTRGILAWYSRATGRLQALPGADDPHYVHTNVVWSPDGKYLVFARAEAKDPYPRGGKLAEYANDPKEMPIQYDLYRIPFNAGKGGRAEPISGASHNGMSNSFPKVSPDGRWIVFVRCRNGQLMRPDSQLYIVPTEGGEARRMRCNTALMNSWHSFSPSGRWLVFSSKSRSPYTQMFLTHLDEEGHDSSAILIENATAANRAVNIPEFVNIPPDGLVKIDVPAVELYRLVDLAWEFAVKGRYEEAITAWKKALEFDPDHVKTHINLGAVLARAGRSDESIMHFQKVLEISPDSTEAHNNLGVALAGMGRLDEAIVHFQKILATNPESAEGHTNLGRALAEKGRLDEAIGHFEKAIAADQGSFDAHNNLGRALVNRNRLDEAIGHFEKALELSPDSAEVHDGLAVALVRKGRLDEAARHFQKVLEVSPDSAEGHYGLGDVLYLKGKIPEALAHWRRVLRAEPNRLALLNQTAWVLATSPEASIRNGTEAVELATRAVRLSGGREPAMLDTLGAAYAEVRRFPEAVETARRALTLVTEQNRQPLATALKARIALYEAQTPFRETRQNPVTPSGP